VRKCDAVGAWLVCLIVAASCFGWPIVTATFSTSVIRYAAAGCEHLGRSADRGSTRTNVNLITIGGLPTFMRGCCPKPRPILIDPFGLTSWTRAATGRAKWPAPVIRLYLG